jgi:hypothetical protein
MKNWRRHLQDGGVARPGPLAPLAPLALLHLVTAHDVQALRDNLAQRGVPTDFEAKLAKLGEGNLIQHQVEQHSRLFIALLLADLERSFTGASPAERERLLRVLAYVRKDEDAIPDYQSGGFADDYQQVRAAATELGPLMRAFKAWRLQHQVPAMWRGGVR